MLKFSRGKLIVFDMEEALSFEGETGPYLQYAVVRANNIFSKLQEREGLTEADMLKALDGAAVDELSHDEGDHDLLGGDVSRRRAWTKSSSRSSARSSSRRSAKYAFGLAQLFNAFYHRYPISERGTAPIGSAGARPASPMSGTQLTRALDLMGIEVPARM